MQMLLGFIAAAFMTLSAWLGLGALPAATSTIETAPQTSTLTQSPAPEAQAAVGARSSATAGTLAPQTAVSGALPAGKPLASEVALGDGKYTTTGPDKGYIYVCHVAQGGRGAQGNATWVHGSSWTPGEKVSVEGSVAWPNASYSMSVTGGVRHITGNGLPTDHPSGTFPIERSDPAFQFDGNPNSIKAQTYDYSLPASPVALAAPDCIFGEVGIMQDGVALFDGFDAEYRDAVAHETQDSWEAHPDASGVYHYHGFESGYLNYAVSQVAGFAFDGYPITGGKLPDGNYLTSADLDACHGITSAVMLDGKEVTTYHYVLTQDFPYSVACFHGRSYEPKPGAGTGAQTGQNEAGAPSGSQGAGSPPQAAIVACSGSGSGSACSFTTQNGTLTGVCRMPPGQTSLACVPH